MKNPLNYLLAISLLFCISCESKNKDASTEAKAENPLLAQLKVEIYDSTALALIAPDARFELLAEGFGWSEGSVWVEALQAVLFADIPANTGYQWSEKDSLRV